MIQYVDAEQGVGISIFTMELKKEKLDKNLYNTHLKAAQEWGNMWYIILDSAHDSIN
jgi:hypothetical protein